MQTIRQGIESTKAAKPTDMEIFKYEDYYDFLRSEIGKKLKKAGLLSVDDIIKLNKQRKEAASLNQTKILEFVGLEEGARDVPMEDDRPAMSHRPVL